MPSLEQASDTAADCFEASWERGVALTKDQEAEGVGKVRGQTKDVAIDLARFHTSELAPAIMPVAVEREIIVKPKTMDITIIGKIDLIDEQPVPEAPSDHVASRQMDIAGDVLRIVRDLKTSEKAPFNKAPDNNAAFNSMQLTIYAMLDAAEQRQKTGKAKLPDALYLDYLVRTPVKGDKYRVSIRTERTMEDIQVLVRRMNVAIDAVKKGVFVPADPGAPGSPCSWCDYKPSCIYVRRG